MVCLAEVWYLWPDDKSSILGVTADLGVPWVCPECTLDMGVLTNSSHFSYQGGMLAEASLTQVAGLLTPSISLECADEDLACGESRTSPCLLTALNTHFFELNEVGGFIAMECYWSGSFVAAP